MRDLESERPAEPAFTRSVGDVAAPLVGRHGLPFPKTWEEYDAAVRSCTCDDVVNADCPLLRKP